VDETDQDVEYFHVHLENTRCSLQLQRQPKAFYRGTGDGNGRAGRL
jgi:hypothetical protein